MCYGLIWANSQLSRTHTPYAWDPAPARAGVQAAARAAWTATRPGTGPGGVRINLHGVRDLPAPAARGRRVDAARR